MRQESSLGLHNVSVKCLPMRNTVNKRCVCFCVLGAVPASPSLLWSFVGVLARSGRSLSVFSCRAFFVVVGCAVCWLWLACRVPACLVVLWCLSACVSACVSACGVFCGVLVCFCPCWAWLFCCFFSAFFLLFGVVWACFFFCFVLKLFLWVGVWAWFFCVFFVCFLLAFFSFGGVLVAVSSVPAVSGSGVVRLAALAGSGCRASRCCAWGVSSGVASALRFAFPVFPLVAPVPFSFSCSGRRLSVVSAPSCSCGGGLSCLRCVVVAGVSASLRLWARGASGAFAAFAGSSFSFRVVVGVGGLAGVALGGWRVVFRSGVPRFFAPSAGWVRPGSSSSRSRCLPPCPPPPVGSAAWRFGRWSACAGCGSVLPSGGCGRSGRGRAWQC